MKNRLHAILVTFLIVTLAGLGSVRAGASPCSAACILCAAPAPVSCCADMLSGDHRAAAVAKQAPASSTVDCPHGEFCPVMNNPFDVGINSANLFDNVVFLVTAPVFHEGVPVTSLQPDVVVPQPPENAFPPLYIRNCSYLI